MTLLRRVTPAVHGAVDPARLVAEGVTLDGLIDFSSNQSPLGAAPGVAEASRRALVDAYPDPRASDFCRAVAAAEGLSSACVVAGNGSTELIRMISSLLVAPGRIALSLGPSFGEYRVAADLSGRAFVEVAARCERPGGGFAYESAAVERALRRLRPALCWACSPNNPTGAVLAPEFLERLVREFDDCLFVLDEAYVDLLPQRQWNPELLAFGNLIVLRSLTKARGLAGLRLGYALCGEETAVALRDAMPPWSVNACAQAAGVAALADSEHYELALNLLRGERDRLMSALEARAHVVEPSAAGFFLVRIDGAAKWRRALLSHGILVRDCASFGLPDCLRLSPRREAENDRLLAAWDVISS